MIRNEEIRKELEEITPWLAKQNLRLGFNVPKGYFDELPEYVLESASPLAELKKRAFKVPANYFESLPDLVLEKVAPEPVREEIASTTPSSNWLDDLINSIAVLFQPRYALRLAGIAILVLGGFFMLRNASDTAGTGELANADKSEYILSLDELTDDELAALMDGEDLDFKIQDVNVSSDIDLDDLTDEELEAFM